MYSVVNLGGFQYSVQLGQSLKVPKIDVEIGQELEIKEVLLTSDGSKTQIGTPVVSEASVVFEVLDHGKYDKIVVFKHKRRKGYRKTQGHRQLFTEVIVKSIKNGADTQIVDAKVIERNHARIKALRIQKQPAVKVSVKKQDTQEAIEIK